MTNRTQTRPKLLTPAAPADAPAPKTAKRGRGSAKKTPDLPAVAATASPKGKLGIVVDLLRRPGGASLEALMAATGWQQHSVRGALSGAVKKKLGLALISEKVDGARVYRIEAEAAA